MARRKRRGGPYSLDLRRLSVYPSFKPHRSGGETSLRIGDIVRVHILSMDDEGRGVGYIRGCKVIVEDAEPGTDVVVKIVGAEGRTFHGQLVVGEGQ
ncbi:MAG: TRAM domain-containing protein [Desulfurococcales archaeon]|nr:TRAM domain-containing protein [Desulfurococcales archaeon]